MDRFVVSVHGGLGNQMFQYALGLRLAQRPGTDLAFDRSFFASAPGAHVQRAFGLDAFGVDLPEASPARIRLARHRGSSFHSWLNSIHPRFAPDATFTERGFAFDPEVLHLHGERYLFGYWQSEKYFVDIIPQIRDVYTFRQPLSAPHAAMAQHIGGSEAISLHVRRGDYLSHAGASTVFEVCGPAYYEAAVRWMMERTERPTFFVFSDDLAWARQHIQAPAPVTFVENQPDTAAHEDMHLMARCRHHIIANSSYSWWGAWLNARPDKQVVAPQRWFRDLTLDTRDLIPPTWTRL